MKNSTAVKRACLCSLILLLASQLHANVELVRNGKPMAEIIVAPNAISSVKLAANDVQKYIELMSGARLPITNALSQGVKNHIYVGPSEYTKKLGVTIDDLKMEGFKIVAQDNSIVLIGRDHQRKPFPFNPKEDESLKKWQEFAGEAYTVPIHEPYNAKLGIFPDDATATLYASSEFLEQLGVRWYNPYENGTVFPEKKTIVVPEQTLKKEPRFPFRRYDFYWIMAGDAQGVLWFKHLKYGASYGVLIGHTTGDVLGWGSPEQREAHPEYFAVVGGKQITVPRLCDEGFRKSSINFLSKTLEAYPWLKVVNLAPTDGLTKIDDRDAKIWFRPERGYMGRCSDYVWDYWLYAAKELKRLYPDRYLRCNSYTPYAETPSQVDTLPDNVALAIAQNTATSFLPGARWEQLRAEWLPMITSQKLFIIDYYNFYRPQFPRYPVFFTKHLQEDMQQLNGVCEGKTIEIWPGPDRNGRYGLACPGLTHMLHYWQGKLYWDPDMDRQKMLTEYYALYFGPAHGEMKEFYEFAEDVWMRPESRSISRTSGFLKESDVDRYFEILQRARRKAGTDTVYDKRIAQIEDEMQPLKTQFANLRRTGPYLHIYTPERYGLSPAIDGDLDKPFWRQQRFWTWYEMGDVVTGEQPEENGASVSLRMTRDKTALIVAVVCDESEMSQLVANIKEHDDPNIVKDDTIEIYITTPERSYFRIMVNAAGAVHKESHDPTIVERDTLPELWDPGIQAAVKRGADHWNLEVLIPTKDFGSLGPSRNYPWGINVCRRRWAGGGDPELYAIAPTGKPEFCDLSSMGDMALGDGAGSRWRGQPEPAGFPGQFHAALAHYKKKEYREAHETFTAAAENAPTAKSRARCLEYAGWSVERLKKPGNG